MKPKIALMISGLATVALIFTPAVAVARDGSSSDDFTGATMASATQTETNETQLEQQRQEREQKIAEIKAEQPEKLDAAKLKLCQKREGVITQNMTNAEAAATSHLDVFTKIADRVIAFANDNNRKPANFDALVADVNAKKTAAQAAIDAAKTVDFSCSGDGPKGQIQAFVTTMQGVKSALRDYRTSIKNLIVAVKNTQPTNTSTENQQ